ncbi:hypothetical protein ACHMW6_31405 [Pseudoduganella sp. UC29_106]|uniref:hypothetical protein n=1 Tax=Pseudoduganella sp. UC29_106 TaxID=3374553 RepID=UPI003756FF04
MELTYKNERVLFFLMMGFSLLFWTALIATVPLPGALCPVLVVLAHVFVNSALAAWLKGTGVKNKLPAVSGPAVARGRLLRAPWLAG